MAYFKKEMVSTGLAMTESGQLSFGEAFVHETGIRRLKMKLHEAETFPVSVYL
jgi:hypothetical protein